VVRRALARNVREARGSDANAATGALGISRRICAMAGSIRRIATSIPPALTFKAVANSRNSLPLPSRLRTKTGIASGNRAHLRRSFPAVAPLMQTFPSLSPPSDRSTSGAKSQANTVRNRQRKPESRHLRPRNRQGNGSMRLFCSPYLRFRKTRLTDPAARKSASFCYTWVIPVHFPLTTKCA